MIAYKEGSVDLNVPLSLNVWEFAKLVSLQLLIKKLFQKYDITFSNFLKLKRIEKHFTKRSFDCLSQRTIKIKMWNLITLWSRYSIKPKSYLLVKNGIDVSKYYKIITIGNKSFK